jgi:acyl carrier protein
VLARALGIGVEGVREAAAIGAQERWDSLAHLCLVMELEVALGRPLAGDEVLEISSLDGIARLLAARRGP